MSSLIQPISLRIHEIGNIPQHVGIAASCATHTAIGVAFSGLSALSGGLSKDINHLADKTKMSSMILRPLYFAGLRIINPDAKTENVSDPSVIAVTVVPPIRKLASQAANNEKSLFQKHVVSRGAYAVGGVVSVIARVADLAIGLVATALSYITLGRFESINDFAVRQLTATAVIDDVCFSVRHIVNPHQAN